MAHGQDGRFGSDGNVIPRLDVKFAPIKQAAEIDDVPRAQVNLASIEKSAAHLDGRAVLHSGEIQIEVAMADPAGWAFPHKRVISVRENAACNDAQIHCSSLWEWFVALRR